MVFYEETDQTRQIKIYNLKGNSKFEIIEHLSTGYEEKEKQPADKISYDDIFKHTQSLLYGYPDDPYYR